MEVSGEGQELLGYLKWKFTDPCVKASDEIWNMTATSVGHQAMPDLSAPRQDWNRLISAGNTAETSPGPAASQVPSRTNNFRGGEIAWQIQLEMSLRGKEAVKTDD